MVALRSCSVSRLSLLRRCALALVSEDGHAYREVRGAVPLLRFMMYMAILCPPINTTFFPAAPTNMPPSFHQQTQHFFIFSNKTCCSFSDNSHKKITRYGLICNVCAAQVGLKTTYSNGGHFPWEFLFLAVCSSGSKVLPLRVIPLPLSSRC